MSAPNFMHKNLCACTVDPVDKQCYVWFHYPDGPGKVHRFTTINAAYKFAHDTTIDHLSLPTLVDSNGNNAIAYDPKHLYNNGTIHCDVDWHNYLCDIITDLNRNAHTNDYVWNIAAGNDIQVAIGLGSTLPNSVSKMYCKVDPIYVNTN